MLLNWKFTEGVYFYKLTEGKEERRPSPVAPISRSVSPNLFSLDLADVNNRTHILANFGHSLYR
jgi:hypothetical protein